jgi:hypothetical protein
MQPINTAEELTRYVEAAGENRNIDAKGPMEWDGGEASAGLTKDILALANSRDGGVLVLGKSEPEKGKFEYNGLSPEQAASFDATKVATWVNNHSAPPIDVVCHHHERQGKTFVVITVAEFSDIPVICTREFVLQGRRPILKKGCIYVRTANVESAPLSSSDELRSLIGIATSKRRDEMLTALNNMLKGRPLLPAKSSEESYQEEIAAMRRGLTAKRGDEFEKGAWTFLFHPAVHEAERWDSTDKLRTLLERSAVQVRGEFPRLQQTMHVREWGIANEIYGDAYGLSRSGLFFLVRPFDENKLRCQEDTNLLPGQWLDFQSNLDDVIEWFMFMSRFIEFFEPGSEVAYELSATVLAGRRLAFQPQFTFGLLPTEPCRASTYRRTKILLAETLRAEWEEECSKALHGFFEFFPGSRISVEVLRKWVEKFKKREF